MKQEIKQKRVTANANGWSLLNVLQLLSKAETGTLNVSERANLMLSLEITSQSEPITEMPQGVPEALCKSGVYSDNLRTALHQMRKSHWDRNKEKDREMAIFLTYLLEECLDLQAYYARLADARKVSAKKLKEQYPPPPKVRSRTDISLSELFEAYA